MPSKNMKCGYPAVIKRKPESKVAQVPVKAVQDSITWDERAIKNSTLSCKTRVSIYVARNYVYVFVCVLCVHAELKNKSQNFKIELLLICLLNVILQITIYCSTTKIPFSTRVGKLLAYTLSHVCFSENFLMLRSQHRLTGSGLAISLIG